MFWSKIWFFIIAAAGFTALAIALVLPRPAERKAIADEERRLADACAVTNILLTDNARVRLNLAGDFSRFANVATVLDSATKSKEVTPDLNKTARDAADELLGSVTGSIKPAFVLMLDAEGRVVARAGQEAEKAKYGDTMAGYHVVDDALHGYLRDDLWLYNNSLYRVAAAPVVRREVGVRDRYAGAVVLGHPVDKDLAEGLREQVRFDVSFYAGGSAKASSNSVELHKDVLEAFDKLENKAERKADCAENKPFNVSVGSDEYAVVVARLPGEAAESGAFYAVYAKRPKAVGFLGTLDAVDGDDMAFGSFPWILLGGLLVVVLGVGMFLMIWEADRPLKKLAADAVLLAKGEADRLSEDKHRGKFGSIARSVNIQLDKQEREAKAAKKDLDQLLGPAPEDSLAGAPSALPMTGPGGFGGLDDAFQPPPPSEFVFKDAPPAAPRGGGGFDLDLPPPPQQAPPPMPPTRAGATATKTGPKFTAPTHEQVPPAPVSLPDAAKPPPPVPRRAPTPPPVASAFASIDEDILGEHELEDVVDDEPDLPSRPPSDFDAPTRVADPSRSLLEQAASPGGNDVAFRKVYDEFLALKQKCGESVKNLTYDKFSTKLKKNRQALIDKHGCREVKFQVYIKDGRAALKATPVKG